VRASFADIREKLATLDRSDPNRKIFAADKHQYRLNPPLDLGDVEKVESLIGCCLPDQYRRFVTEFADGGGGPCYGIFPLGRLLESDADTGWLADLATPFPAPKSVEEMRELGYSALGALAVSEIGCGGMYWLILSGSERGFVWVQNPEGDWSPELASESHLPSYSEKSGIEPVLEAALASPASLKLQFVDWYNRWLDDSLQEASRIRGRQ
jgi:hypothetical protein